MASAMVGSPMISYHRSIGTWLVMMTERISCLSSMISSRSRRCSAFKVSGHRRAPGAEAFRRPFGVTPVRAWHMRGIGALPRPTIAALVQRDPLAMVEDLDGSGRGAGIDLLADQLVRYRIEKAADFNVVIQRDAGEPHSANS